MVVNGGAMKQETVVHASNRLAITALQMAKGSHSKRTREFVKACITFNEISIPSITSVVPRIHLFLETAQVMNLGLKESYSSVWILKQHKELCKCKFQGKNS
jgi:hypothetical protein